MLNRLYNWYGKRTVWGVIALIALLSASALLLSLQSEGVAESQNGSDTKTVRVASVAELASDSGIELLGSVIAVSEAKIQSEASGRVTNVRVSIGDSVRAGSVIAELENATERAAVLQAEGAYEAALAGAAQSDVSVSDAEASLRSARAAGINTYRSAFTTVDGTVSNLIDKLYTNPESGIIGFRLEGPTYEVNNRRIALRGVLTDWAQKLNTVDPANVDERLAEAEVAALEVAALLNILAQVVADNSNKNTTIAGNTMESYQTRFASARSSIDGVLQSIESAQSTIANREDALTRAAIGGTGGALSGADAQVKQALGSLRAAQARLAETIFRSPISGTVNELNIRSGDYVGMSERVATIANNDALLITAYMSESDRGRVSVGDTVTIERGITGTITAVAPSVDPSTKKVKVEIQTEGNGIANGETVRLFIPIHSDRTEFDRITIPVSALKVETDRIVVFTVSDEQTLVAHEIEEGPLVGSDIIIESGVTLDMEIVQDARGLSEGDAVEIIQ